MKDILCFIIIAVLLRGNDSYASLSPSNLRREVPGLREYTKEVFSDCNDVHRRNAHARHAHSGSEKVETISDKIASDGLCGRGRISVLTGAKRGEFVSQDPKYLLEDTSSYQQAIKSLQEMLKGMQTGSLSKGKSLRWKRLGKGYLDYTNSQMPFNEGTKRSWKEKGKKEDAASNYSRVRRFLEEERMMKGKTTLEAKEAAMSRVLDPNLNLDGILEPHVRKRRRRSIPQK